MSTKDKPWTHLVILAAAWAGVRKWDLAPARVTPTQTVTSKGRFRRDTGEPWGSDYGWTAAGLVPIQGLPAIP